MAKQPRGGPIRRTDAAVIDVGSNSVRLVIYRVEGRAMTPILNEKVMAGLGRDLSASGVLHPEGRSRALAALKRFAMLIDAFKASPVLTAATAAVRSAEDGAAFIDLVAAETGLRLRVVEGAEEARLSGLGVLAGAADPEGVVGDLGGSSLELVQLHGGAPRSAESYPIGPLAWGQADANTAAMLSDSRALAGPPGRTFYAVGGAWRALGRIDIALRGHPLRVLHQHELSLDQAMRVVDVVRKQSKRSLEQFEAAAAKRADTLPYAAALLGQVLDIGRFEKVVLSAYGLREGLLFDSLPAKTRAYDPLIASAQAFGDLSERSRRFGAALGDWIEPLFSGLPGWDEPGEARLRRAACQLADIGAALHPDQRSSVVFELILRSPMVGLSHTDRAFLATAVHHRYTKGAHAAQGEITEKLIAPERIARAAAVGTAMRLGADVSGRSDTVLALISLRRQEDRLVLSAKRGAQHLLTETSVRRIEPLAAQLGLQARVG